MNHSDQTRENATSYFMNYTENTMENSTTPNTTVESKIFRSSTAVEISFYYQIIVLIFGFVGNSVTIVLMRKTKTPVTTRAMLTTLAISDNIYLVGNLPTIIAEKYFNAVFYELSTAICRYWAFIGVFCNSVSYWTVACLTVERCIAVAQPFKLRIIQSLKKHLLALSALLFYCLTWAIVVTIDHQLVEIFDNEGNNIGTFCQTVILLPYIEEIDLNVNTLVPLCIVLVGNVMLCVFLKKHRSKMSTIQSPQNSRTSHKDSRLFLTTLAVSLALVIFSVPSALYFSVGEHIIGPEKYTNPNNTFYLFQDSWSYTNFGINFYLYVAFTKSFRETVRQTIGSMSQHCCHQGSDQRSSIETVSRTSI